MLSRFSRLIHVLRLNPKSVRTVKVSPRANKLFVLISLASAVILASCSGLTSIGIKPSGISISSISPNYGPISGGSQIVITGSGFTGATTVDFGSTPGTDVKVISSTSISVTSPKGTGTVVVTVTTPSGTSANSSADMFNYVSATCTPSLASDHTPKYVVILADGIGSATTGGSYDPLSTSPWSDAPASPSDSGVGPNGYCVPSSGSMSDKPPPLQSILNDYKPAGGFPSQSGDGYATLSLTDALGQAGAVIIPFSYKGAILSGSPLAPTLTVQSSVSTDPGNNSPISEAQVLGDEINSIHQVWENAKITVIGHSNGGLVAELWWQTVAGGNASSFGVQHIYALDSPIGGVQDANGTALESALEKLCSGLDLAAQKATGVCQFINNFGTAALPAYAQLWNTQSTVDAAIMAADTSGQFTAIGTLNDILYKLGDFPVTGISSQLMYVGGCKTSISSSCKQGSNSYQSSCDGSGLSAAIEGVSHELVENCTSVINEIVCTLPGNSSRCLVNNVIQEALKTETASVSGVSPSVARVGQVIDITGQGFGSVAGKVGFASARGIDTGQILSWNDRSIKVVVPSDAVTGLIGVQPAAQGSIAVTAGALVIEPS